MQTFLPYADFRQSAEALDYRRLGKQRVECLQLLNSLLGVTNSKGWSNHPARNMWRGHEKSLVRYTLTVCEVWKGKGYKDTVTEKVQALADTHLQDASEDAPAWLGDEDFHRSHRSNLIRKLPEHYQPQWPTESADLPYIWPVHNV